MNTRMLGFALSPDGAKVALGGPSAGIFTAPASTLDFEMSGPLRTSIQCLSWTGRGLYAGALEAADSFTLALSNDQGASWSPLWHLDSAVPLSCPAETAGHDLCAIDDPGANSPPAAEPSTSASANSSHCACRMGTARENGALYAALLALLFAAATRRLKRDSF